MNDRQPPPSPQLLVDGSGHAFFRLLSVFTLVEAEEGRGLVFGEEIARTKGGNLFSKVPHLAEGVRVQEAEGLEEAEA